MRILVLAALALPAASAAGQWTPFPTPNHAPRTITPPSGKPCPSDLRRAREKQRIEGKKLGELPPDELHLTVYREVDGCQVPALVHEKRK